MSKTPLDIVVPIFNEGDRIINLFKEFDKNIKTSFRVLLLRPQEDDVFNYSDKLMNLSLKLLWLKTLKVDHHLLLKRG